MLSGLERYDADRLRILPGHSGREVGQDGDPGPIARVETAGDAADLRSELEHGQCGDAALHLLLDPDDEIRERRTSEDDRPRSLRHQVPLVHRDFAKKPEEARRVSKGRVGDCCRRTGAAEIERVP